MCCRCATPSRRRPHPPTLPSYHPSPGAPRLREDGRILLRYLVITPHQVRHAFERTAAALEGRSGVDCTFSGSTAVLVLVTTTKGTSIGAKGGAHPGAKGGAHHPKGSSGSSGSSGSRREITVGFVGDSRAVLGRSGQAGGGGGGGGGGRQRPAEVTAMVLTPAPTPAPTPTPTPTPTPYPLPPPPAPTPNP